MRYKVKHYINTGRRISSRNNHDQWEALRANKREKAYSIENSIEAYEDSCKRNLDSKYVAQIIDRVFGHKSLRIASLGVGKGNLEWHLKQMNPNLFICCTDFTGKELLELQKVFPAADEICQFDMLKDNWGRLSNFDFLLLNRLNSEFDFAQWKGIFKEMAEKKICKVIYVPSRFGSVCNFISTLRPPKLVVDKSIIHIAWCYTEYDLVRTWKDYYKIVKKISFNDSAIYFLELRRE